MILSFSGMANRVKSFFMKNSLKWTKYAKFGSGFNIQILNGQALIALAACSAKILKLKRFLIEIERLKMAACAEF